MNYKKWSDIEDAKLIEALVNMVNSGLYKADNGFKFGYLLHLEKEMKEALPNAGILGKPYIESRIKTLKKDWQVNYDMGMASGFGYDSATKCVTVDSPKVWDDYVAVHKGAKKWKNTPFPHFEDLCIVFSKDRAQGHLAKDFIELELEDTNAEEETQQADIDLVSETPVINPQSEEKSSAHSKKQKRRSDPIAEGITKAATLLGDKLQEALANLSQSLKAEMDFQSKTSKVTSKIFKMQCFFVEERFKASRKIMHELEAVLTFWGIKEDDRQTFVDLMLKK